MKFGKRKGILRGYENSIKFQYLLNRKSIANFVLLAVIRLGLVF